MIAKQPRGICPVPVNRDARGYWTHPVMAMAAPETSAEMNFWLRSYGLECRVMYMRDEDTDAFLAGFDDEAPDARGWTLTPPPGDGWFIGSVHDSDAGPVCYWLRSASGAAV